MMHRLKTHLGYLQKNENLSGAGFSGLYGILNPENIKNNPDFVVYNTEKFLPTEENKKHFASLASILSVENGYFGTRSCLEECYGDIATGASYIAGIYMVNDDLITDKLAVMPDWTRVCIFIEDEPFDILNQEVLEHTRYFDIKRGVSVRQARVKDCQGRITCLRTKKFASLKNKHLAGQSISIIPENYGAAVSIRTGIDGSMLILNEKPTLILFRFQ